MGMRKRWDWKQKRAASFSSFSLSYREQMPS